MLAKEKRARLAVDLPPQLRTVISLHRIQRPLEIVECLGRVAQVPVHTAGVIEGFGQEMRVTDRGVIVHQRTDQAVGCVRHVRLVRSLDAEQAVVHAVTQGKALSVRGKTVQQGKGTFRIGGAQAVRRQQGGRVRAGTAGCGQRKQHEKNEAQSCHGKPVGHHP